MLASSLYEMCIHIYLLTFRSDRINLVDEDDCRGGLLSLLRRFPRVAFTLTRHLTHDLGAIDQKEERSFSFVTARAMSVLPVPGGPNRRMPRDGLIPINLNSWG
jgi:hypothetical protein